MKIITWNCQGAFRKKIDKILLELPDILIIQECEHPDKLILNSTTQTPNDFLWFGDNRHRGLGILSYSNYKFQLLNPHNSDIKIIAPISVTGGELDFTLFAIWANNRQDPDGQYIEQVYKAVSYYAHLLSSEKTILIGDFNSNKIWDRKHRVNNHSSVVDKLAEKGIYSVYHKHFMQKQGKESHPTFFMNRNKDKSYHIDYCFLSEDLCDKVRSIEVGTFENWISYSDHIPLSISFDL
jgi:exodeoxyribonuclease III